MTDARKRAEEALARWDALPSGDVDDLAAWDVARDGMERFRALLASEPETKHPGHDRIAELESLLRECNAVCLCGCPESEHESYGEDGESCGHDDHECIRVAPAVLEIVQRYRVALSDALRAQPAPPPSDAVREAAERLWYRLTPPANVTENGCVFVPAEDLETVLRANASPAPGGKGVREAEAVLAEAREALDEIRRRSMDKLAGEMGAAIGYFARVSQPALSRPATKGGE